MKKLAIAVMLGLGIMVSGCGNQQTTQQQTTKVECGYEHGDFGGYTASNPVQLEVGKQFGFGGAMEFDSKRIDAENHKVYGLVIRDDVALYEVDVNNAPQGWDKLENRNNVYIADNIIRERMLVGDLVDQGIYPIEKVKDVSDLLKFVDVTIVQAHIVHHHTKECK